METSFTPWAGITGGALIGLASAMLLLARGRIAGISGILGRSFFATADDRGWHFAFLFGLPLGSWFAMVATSDAAGFTITANPLLLIGGGLLVGIGTQMGNGCTSGHGVCGMARGSKRSIIATLTFMGTAGVTVFIIRHVIGGAL